MATKRLSVGAAKPNLQKAQTDDTRQLMRQTEMQKRIAGLKRVEHPLARYNKLDQLSCAICLIPMKNEASWTAHLLSKSHKENVDKFKKGETIVAPVSSSRNAVPSAAPSQQKRMSDDEMEQDSGDTSNGSDQIEEPPAKQTKMAGGEIPESKSNLPADFFDSAPSSSTSTTVSKVVEKHPQKESSEFAEPTSKLPEGFFDDAKQDAKVRQVKFVDKFEDVWSDFQKEIAKETQVSRAIVDEEEDKLFIVRDVAEIDEEIERWARVEALHNKRDAQKSSTAAKMDTSSEDIHRSTAKNSAVAEESSDEDEEFSIEDTLNWRKKKF